MTVFINNIQKQKEKNESRSLNLKFDFPIWWKRKWQRNSLTNWSISVNWFKWVFSTVWIKLHFYNPVFFIKDWTLMRLFSTNWTLMNCNSSLRFRWVFSTVRFKIHFCNPDFLNLGWTLCNHQMKLFSTNWTWMNCNSSLGFKWVFSI